MESQVAFRGAYKVYSWWDKHDPPSYVHFPLLSSELKYLLKPLEYDLVSSSKCYLEFIILTEREEAVRMARVKAQTSPGNTKKPRTPLTPEARENQMIALAMDLVEQRLLDGTASSQETTHFLKLGSSKAVLERDRLLHENELLRAKTKALDNAEEIKILYQDALAAMRNYAGQGDPNDYAEY